MFPHARLKVDYKPIHAQIRKHVEGTEAKRAFYHELVDHEMGTAFDMRRTAVLSGAAEGGWRMHIPSGRTNRAHYLHALATRFDARMPVASSAERLICNESAALHSYGLDSSLSLRVCD